MIVSCHTGARVLGNLRSARLQISAYIYNIYNFLFLWTWRNASQFVGNRSWVRSHHCHFLRRRCNFFSSFVQFITYYYHVNYIARILRLLSFFKRFSLCYSIVLHSDADFLYVFCIISPVIRCNFSADFYYNCIYVYRSWLTSSAKCFSSHY